MSQIMRKDSSISAASHRQHHRSIDIGGGGGVGESSIVERDRGPPRSAPPTSGGAKMAAVLEKPRTISDSESEINYDLFNTSVHSDSGSVVMNASQLSTTSCESAAVHIKSANLTRSQNASNGSCRFPKLEECAHFHYERVQLGNLSVQLEGDEGRSDSQLGLAPSDLNASQAPSLANSMTTSGPALPKASSNAWFIIRVTAGRSDPFMIKRSFENMCFLDEMLHRCVYDRRVSELENLRDGPPEGGLGEAEQQLERMVGAYLCRLSVIASDAMTCGPVLTWLQIDNKGRRLPVADEQTMRCINTPAVGAAYGVRRYVAQACDEISIEVGDMISVIDMPSPAESIWWRGKKSHLQKNQYEVGFFPQSCVATIGDKVPRHMPFPAPLVGSLAVSPTKPVLRKHGKLIAFFRSFILSRPSRRRLKQSGIYRERVFSCDLGEHLLNSGQDIPMVLKCCAEFIEEYGIVDGIYRLSGITSNIQKLRRAFDEERIPDLAHPDIRQDIHAVSSLLKMYFRELPNPLCTYQLYDHFVEAIQTRLDAPNGLKLRLIRQTVQKLPPPHYRTLKYLATHLFKISRHSANTGMTERNIAIVWAPNLLRSPALESGGVAALRGVGVQAVVTEYLISNCEQIFDDTADDFGSHYVESQPNSLSDSNSVQNYAGSGGEQQDLSLTLSERPKSLSGGGAKLLSLEEARIRRNCVEQSEKTVPINIGTSTHIGSYIEVGGGPSSLPDKYHTVLPVPRSWNKRKSHSSWKSIFTRQPRQSNSNSDIKAAGGGRASGEKGAPMVMVLPSVADASGAASLDESKDDADDRRRSVSIKESSSGLLDKMAKSLLFSSGVDLFDGKNLAIDSSCMRSNSVDSLRTAGHSRSVSHDSYFDLLQSPMRGGTGTAGNNGAGAVTCPSRELSELGLNFDREEPEMRIFSESESLVSSPKVVKESVRRTLRARPEDYVGSGHSVNPSPKKQPRLNIPSPSEAQNKQWGACESSAGQQQDDESLCKRYKLEDQLSDIQFIDCNTPEHIGASGASAGGSAASSAGMMNTIFTSAQVHRPPRDDGDDQDQRQSSSSSVVEMVGLRNSYPGAQYGYVKYDTSPIKETRFSYPGSGAKGKKEDAPNAGGAKVQSMNVDEQPQPATSASPVLKKNESSLYESFLLTSGQSKPPKYPGRYSYHQPVTAAAAAAAAARAEGGADGELVPRSSSENLLRRSATESLSQAHHHHHHHHHHHPSSSSHHHHHHGHSKQNTPSAPSSKQQQQLGVVATGGPGTPQSPGVPSPCYSLLIGSTSSTDTTTDTTTTTTSNGPGGDGTPVYDEMDIAGALVAHLEIQNAKECGPLPTPPAPKPSSKRSADLKAMKRELSLDLSGASNSKLTASNFTSDNTTTTNTTNTSQSMTPSDFAYQNLHPDLSPNGCTLQADGSAAAAAAPVEMATFGQKPKPGTPIKATINITYNVRSPVRKEQEGNLFAVTPPTTPQERASRGMSMMLMGHEEELIDEDEYRRERRSIYENVLVPAVDKDERENESAIAVAGAEAKRLLETNFDETMVYEQVKLLKNVVSEVNHLVRQEEGPLPRDDRPHEVPELGRADESTRSTEEDGLNNNATVACGGSVKLQHCCEDESLDSSGPVASTGGTVVMEEESEDVPMSDVNEDSLEFDNTDDLSLYENVELRKNTFPVYENVSQGRQPMAASTGTIDGQTDTTAPKSALLTDNDDEFSSLCADRSDLDNEMEYRIEVAPKIELNRESPTQNVSVKQLATKFETSPIEAVAPPFDFGATRGGQHQFRSSLTSGASDRVVFRNKAGAANGTTSAGGGKDGSGGAFASFTRSLDENAFVREFGSGRRLEGYVAGLTKSIAQIPEVEKNILNENNPNRRKSLELNAGGRPRSLNQPKKLPPLTGGGGAGSPTGVENVDISQGGGETDGGKGTKPQLGSECCRVVKGLAGGYKQSGAPLGTQDPTAANMKLDLSTKIEDTKEARAYNVRITPTTENRISLVQYNYADNEREANMLNVCDGGEPVLVRATGRRRDESVSEEERHSSGLKMLGSCKLDRSRIEKIKEERRHQLSEKYRSESFKGERDYGGAGGGKAKSKSKSELREFKEGDVVADRGDKKYDSLRFRSKSRTELLSSDGLFGGLLEGSANPGLLGSVSLNTVAMAQNTVPTIVGLRPVSNNRTRRISDEKNQNDIPPPPPPVVVGTVAIGTTTHSGSPTNNGGGPISDATISQVCDNKFELKTRQKFDKRSSMDYPPAGPTDGQQKEPHRETPRNSFNHGGGANGGGVKAQVIVTRSNSSSTQRDRCSPPISIKDVAAMFESRSQQNQS